MGMGALIGVKAQLVAQRRPAPRNRNQRAVEGFIVVYPEIGLPLVIYELGRDNRITTSPVRRKHALELAEHEHERSLDARLPQLLAPPAEQNRAGHRCEVGLHLQTIAAVAHGECSANCSGRVTG